MRKKCVKKEDETTESWRGRDCERENDPEKVGRKGKEAAMTSAPTGTNVSANN